MTDILVVPPGDQPEDRLEELRKVGKIPWAQRVDLIRQQFPSVAALNWYQVFRQDPAILGRIVNDIIKVDQAVPGKPGKRPSLDERKADERLRQLVNEDYSNLPFDETFRFLAGDRSIRHVARLTGIDKTRVMRLMDGRSAPDAETMEAVATAFKKDPSYFVEYRLAYITAVLTYKLESIPETTIGFFQRLQPKTAS